MSFTLTYILALLWLAFWLSMLTHCLRRKSTPGVLGGRAAWLWALLLADPLMSLMYFVFAVLKVGLGRRWVNWVVALGLLTVLPGWLMALIPSGNQTFDRGEEGRWNISCVSELQAGTTIAHSSSNWSQTNQTEYVTVVAPKRVQVFLDGDAARLSGVGTQLAQRLSELKCIEQIEVVRAGSELSGKRAPDLRIRISGKETYPIPKWFRLSPWSLMPTQMKFNFRTTPFSTNIHASYSPKMVRMRPQLEVNGSYQFVTYGYANADLRWFSGNDLDEHANNLMEDLERLLQNSPQVEAFPEACYGTFQPAPDFDFLERLGARMVTAESDLLLHSKVAWSFTMPGWEELERIRDELVEKGYPDPHGPPEGFATTLGENGDQWVGLEPTYEFLGTSHTVYEVGASEVIRPEVAGVEFTFQYRRHLSRPEIDVATDAIRALNNPGFLDSWLRHPVVRVGK